MNAKALTAQELHRFEARHSGWLRPRRHTSLATNKGIEQRLS